MRSPAPTRAATIRGMTLIEILAVVVILSLIAATLTMGIMGKVAKARTEIAKTQIALIVGQVQAYHLEKRTYPPASLGLKALSEDPRSSYHVEPERLVDPWGRPYLYLVPGPSGAPFEILSYGADGRSGGQGEDADVASGK